MCICTLVYMCMYNYVYFEIYLNLNSTFNMHSISYAENYADIIGMTAYVHT